MRKTIVSILLVLMVLSAVFAGGAGESTAGAAAGQSVFAGGWPYSTVPTGHFNMFVSNAIELKY